MFAALFNGAALCPYDLKAEGFDGLGQWLIDERITLYHSVPTVFRQFAESLSGREDFPDLRIVRLGGEPVYSRDLNSFKTHFPIVFSSTGLEALRREVSGCFFWRRGRNCAIT
jgi:acyl-coenzyme A synthetase/AMP-(fatty) acid ligase